MTHFNNLSITPIIGEEWADVIGYEGLYMVSNLGRVKTLERQDLETGYGNYFRYSKIKKQAYSTNYLAVTLFKNVRRRYLIHRLVAAAFIKNTGNKKCVNHKNGIKNDNRAINLEWVTHSENNIHAFKTGLRENKKGADNPRSKKVIQMAKDGGYIKTFPSVTAAASNVNCGITRISAVCRNKKYRTTAYGFRWSYA